MSDTPAPAYFGRYQVLEELGSGAMGVVYLCVDARLARPVAVKVIKDQALLAPAEREQYLARFRQEAEAAGRLSHPDIVQVYDVGSSYIVMEFVEGRPLSQVIESAEPLRVGEIVALLERVGDALDYAHRQGVVHRDVKPANIMRLDDGGVKVMDFGVARLPSSTLTAFGTVVGSVRYMAPEQMMGRPVDGRADVFALGAVAYELLTGQAPFPGKTATEVVTRVVHGNHVPVCRVEPRLPRACDRVFAHVFAADPARRTACAMDFARELGEAARAAASLCVRARTAAPSEPTPTTLETLEAADVPTRLLGPESAPPAPTAILTADAPLDAHAPTRLVATAPLTAEAWLAVESRPSRARVRLDGQDVGFTPLVAVPLALGRHRLLVEREGCIPATLELEASATDRLHNLSVTLARAAVETKSDGVVPFEPRMTPPRRIAGEPPAAPPGLCGVGVPRTAVVECVVQADGSVSDLTVRESAGAPCDTALLAALGRWTFTPARRDGAPVAVRLRVTHRFGA